MRSSAATVLLVLASLAAGPATARADFVNPSFETGSYVFNGQGGDSLQPGSTAIAGWNTFGGELAVLQNGNSYGIATPYGNMFLDLTGYHDTVPYGGVQQSVATVSGQTYLMTLALGVDNGGSYSGPVSVLVTAGSSSATLTANPIGSGNIWTQETFSFVATSANTLVSIQGSSGGQYIGLDNLSINSGAVPEPSSLTLCGLALLAGLGYARARRGPAGP